MTEKERLQKIMEQENLSQTQFADRIGINRPTLSHIMKGRNAPSLDVLQKTLHVFRSISTDWLILGVGPMYRTNSFSQQTLFDVKPEVVSEKEVQAIDLPIKEVESVPSQSIIKPVVEDSITEKSTKTISKIVVFYSDNTFEELVK